MPGIVSGILMTMKYISRPTLFNKNRIMRKKLCLICSILTVSLFSAAQRVVSQAEMTGIYNQIKTPYKYGLVITPEDNNHKIDCPTVFRHQDKWYMTYLIYDGSNLTDGRGYETWIAQSDDLLNWNTLGRILSFRDGFWDMNQRGGFPALPDMEWGGSYTLRPFDGKYWMSYIGGANQGYERDPLRIGLASIPEEYLGQSIEWVSLDRPLLSSEDKDTQWFEEITQYKSTIYQDKDEVLGVPFVLFYNAKGRHPHTGLKAERIGIALSKDLKTWKRYPGNPVFSFESENTITGDAHIQKIGNIYVMFYFRAHDPSRKYKAYNTFACSYDLVNWYEWQGDDLVIPGKTYDNKYAHKSYVINHDGIVYHFYCAVNQSDQRGIAVATNKPVGESTVHFPKLKTESH